MMDKRQRKREYSKRPGQEIDSKDIPPPPVFPTMPHILLLLIFE
jgi:hypothetical protein